MRYSRIDEFEICNGNGVGISLFVQGCPIHCDGCFNQETWDFNGGKEWTKEVKKKFLDLADKPHIKRISILGGEPLAPQNAYGVADLIEAIRNRYSDSKEIWLYTGYNCAEKLVEPLLHELILNCNYIVDGNYIQEQRDLSLRFRGSKNQHIWKVTNGSLEKVE